jgi:hypothetical protein
MLYVHTTISKLRRTVARLCKRILDALGFFGGSPGPWMEGHVHSKSTPIRLRYLGTAQYVFVLHLWLPYGRKNCCSFQDSLLRSSAWFYLPNLQRYPWSGIVRDSQGKDLVEPRILLATRLKLHPINCNCVCYQRSFRVYVDI